jgi:activator of HSP90 ATPase
VALPVSAKFQNENKMPINYSKWNSIDVSDSDEEEQVKKSPVIKKTDAPTKPAPPKEAIGSAWNASNFHWEEQKLDDWGKARFKELLTSSAFRSELCWNSSRLECSFSFSCTELEGEAWTHIRKGKSVLGYNFEAKLGFLGKIKAVGLREEEFSGELSADLMVDNEPDVECELRTGSQLPFSKELRSTVRKLFSDVLGKFIAELDEKARFQKQKTESAASPSPNAAAENMPTASNSGVAPKSHFGGRVQVGGHNPDGLRIT